jgi:hypothetical protein
VGPLQGQEVRRDLRVDGAFPLVGMQAGVLSHGCVVSPMPGRRKMLHNVSYLGEKYSGDNLQLTE